MCLWEILTKCEVRPYLEVEKDDSSAMVKHLSQDGHRLSKPPESSEAIYGVLTHCWSQFGKNRPSLEAIQTALKAITPRVILSKMELLAMPWKMPT